MTPWTAFHHAISALFPAWERAFAAVALHHQPNVCSALAARIDAFAREETAHAKAHAAYNQRHGLIALEAEEFKKARVIHRRPGMKIWLGTMVSIEHFAACMGRMLLERFEGETGRDRQLFNWHARQEIGHKDLAIDIWRELGHSDKDLRSIARQNQAYVLRHIFLMVLIKTDWKKPSNWLGAMNWGWWMTKRVLIPMLAIYLPNFHPNWFNDKEVLA